MFYYYFFCFIIHDYHFPFSKIIITLKFGKKKKNVNTDKVLVVSGFRPDDNFIDKANAAGFAVKDSGKKMDLLVIKDDSYLDKSKGRYAQSKSIDIMTLNEFKKKYIGA